MEVYMPAVRLKKGKGEYIRRKLISGEIEQICLCVLNADFSSRGCLSQVHGSLLQEVVENKGRYVKERMREHRRTVGTDHRCTYCSQQRHNWGKCPRLKVNELTERDFERFKPEVVRIGKNTESLHPFYIPVFLDFLNLCEGYVTKIIAPTKAFHFSRDLADRLVGRGVVNYSIGNDSFESGAVSQGHTNEWRIEQARLYRERGVNSTLTLTCDVTSSIEENAVRGFAIKKALEAGRKYKIPIRILPLRLNSKELAKLATGKNWEEIVFDPDALDSLNDSVPDFYDFLYVSLKKRMRYMRRGNNEAAAAYLHPDFQQLVDSGIGICGQVGEDEHCDKCQVFSSDVRIRFPVSELVPVTYSKEFYKDRKNYREKKKRQKREGRDRHQKEIKW